MALKTVNQNPKTTDTILLQIETPDSLGCFISNPYRVDSVVVYYVERDFLGTNYGEYNKSTIDPNLEDKLNKAQKNLCDNPTVDNVSIVQSILSEIASRSQNTTFYYKDRKIVKTIGNPMYPAWLSTDTTESPLTLESLDSENNTQYGHFSYEWSPNGSIRGGDYFVCWTWTPNIAGEKLSAHIQFSIDGDTNAVLTIPTHATKSGKYETLLERYLPDMYKNTLTDNDLTPQILDKLNVSIAQGFTFIEDMSNQIIDLFDANALHESMLVYLSNLFNLKLKSDDPTLWRRQIKEAVPVFKKKGTFNGLKEAFAQAGMELTKFTQYWQLVSPYTWTESFKVSDSPTFTLEKDTLIQPINPDNFGLWLKRAGTTTYYALSQDYVSFATAIDGSIEMTWIGDNLSMNGIDLMTGDTLKVLYQYTAIDNDPEQQLENYIQSLPLADQRDEDAQIAPLKNWNVRLIDEGDPLFNILIPVRTPFQNSLIFGHIRTDFAYSENIYNMEEYNGSTRPSFDPCHIDRNFIDPCGACLSSNYSVDISVQQLSNDRMLEAQEILREYTPFHAQVHSLNFSGEVNEFVLSPVETVETLVTIDYAQFILSGNSNPFFNRMMVGGLSEFIVDREDLTDQITVISSATGLAYSEQISLVTPDVSLQNSGINFDSHIMEVLAPSGNAGTYMIKDIHGNMAKLATYVIEPLDESAFTFNLINILYSNNISSIRKNNLCLLTDVNVDFDLYGVMTLWDIEHTPNYSGGSWKVLIPAYSNVAYEINNVTGGILSLKDTSTLPTSNTSNITYMLYDDNNHLKATSTTGVLKITQRGYIDFNDLEVVNLQDVLKVGDQLHYDGVNYNVSQLDGNNFWIDNYSDGNVEGASIQTRRTVIKEQIGYFGYKGLHLTTSADYEDQFGIINGENPPSEDNQTDNNLFKENFMFLINGNYFKIVSINGTEVVLIGKEQNWPTLGAGGTTVNYSLVKFPAKEVTVSFTVFDHLNRNGKDPVIREIESQIDNSIAIVALSASNESGMQENVSQEEGITFIIETRDGKIIEGEI